MRKQSAWKTLSIACGLLLGMGAFYTLLHPAGAAPATGPRPDAYPWADSPSDGPPDISAGATFVRTFRVLDREGRRVRGASATCMPVWAGHVPPMRASAPCTDESGMLSVSVPTGVAMVCLFTHPDYLEARSIVRAYACEGRLVETVVLDRSTGLSGTLLDAAGAPFASATVDFYVACGLGAEERVLMRAATDAQGRFRLVGVPATRVALAAQSGPGRADRLAWSTPPLSCAAGETLDLGAIRPIGPSPAREPGDPDTGQEAKMPVHEAAGHRMNPELRP